MNQLAETTDTTRLADHPVRQMPYNTDAERGLLGAILIDNTALEIPLEYLRAEHFMAVQHALIFQACVDLVESGQIADPITLKRHFEQSGSLEDVGGPRYLVDLSEAAPTTLNAKAYARVVYDLAVKRELISLCRETTDAVFEAEVDVDSSSLIELAEERLFGLAETGQYDRGARAFKDVAIEAMKLAAAAHKRDGALAGVATGLTKLDELLGGMHRSDLLILAGRPAMGKTALATNIAYHAAHLYRQSEGAEGAAVGFFSLEMSGEQLATRIISEQASISSDLIRKGKVSNDDFPRLVAATQELISLPMVIDDTPALTIAGLRTRARRLKRTHGVGLIVVDYLQLMQGSNTSRNDGRVQEVSEITRGLKTIAKELDVAVVALSQLSRKVEERDDKRPHLADLRESGTIEQDADVVMFIYREEYYLEKSEPQESMDLSPEKYLERQARWEARLEKVHGTADVIVAKQRHGPVGTVTLAFEGELTRFSNLYEGGDGHGGVPEWMS